VCCRGCGFRGCAAGGVALGVLQGVWLRGTAGGVALGILQAVCDFRGADLGVVRSVMMMKCLAHHEHIGDQCMVISLDDVMFGEC
jgi:hypothetical protein